MKIKFAFLFFMLLIGAPISPVYGQTHFLFGPEGGYDFGNTNIGIETRIEVPVKRHFEIDGDAEINPYESHISLGHGISYGLKPATILWVSNTSGFEGEYSRTAYTVTKAVKTANYFYAGYVYRHTMVGFPTRFHFEYFQQILNGISQNGTETNHLLGGAFTFDSLQGCFKSGCVRSKFTLNSGRVLNQGNPQCDGQYNKVITCPRQSVFSGGFEANILFEFPRRNSSNELF